MTATNYRTPQQVETFFLPPSTFDLPCASKRSLKVVHRPLHSRALLRGGAIASVSLNKDFAVFHRNREVSAA